MIKPKCLALKPEYTSHFWLTRASCRRRVLQIKGIFLINHDRLAEWLIVYERLREELEFIKSRNDVDFRFPTLAGAIL